MKKLLVLLATVLLAAAPLGAQTVFRASEVTISSDKIMVGDKQFFSHIVRDKQTLYSIGKAYGVSSLDIIDANPSLNLDRRSIKAGDVLLIPATQKALDAAKLQAEKAKQVEEKADSTLQTETIQVDTTAPVPVTIPEEVVVLPADSLLIPLENITDTIEDVVVPVPQFVFDIPEVINVTMMLPMGADSTANVRYMNFYFGALLAARDLSERGVKMDIRTIDTANKKAFQEAGKAFQDSDVIIGPVSAADISMALPLLPEGKFLISPMDARTEELAIDSPVILAATPASQQVKDAVKWLVEEKAEADSLIMVSETGVKQGINLFLLKNEVDSAKISNRMDVDYSVANGLEMNEWFAVHTHLKDTVTHVIAVSERDVFVNDVIRNVYLQNSMKHNVIIYGPARTRSADVEEMCNARLHNSVTYYVDYNRREVIDFINNYRALFHAEPDGFAFHGYDTMRYFVSICSVYGRNWEMKLEEYTQSGLQTYFKFDDKGEMTGHVNSGLRRVLYKPGFNITVSDK